MTLIKMMTTMIRVVRETETERQKQRETETDIQTERRRQRQRETGTETETDIQTETETRTDLRLTSDDACKGGNLVPDCRLTLTEVSKVPRCCLDSDKRE